MNVFSMGEKEAKSLGLNTEVLKFLIIVCTTLITATSVAFCGVIGWVGLVIPHLCRMLVGPDHKSLIPASILIGATYLLIIDNLCRIISAAEVPIGILTAVVGAPIFAYLLRKTKGVELMQPIVSVKNASFSYQNKEVLRNVNIDIFEGETVCLLGPNGCGKTTLLNCINNTLQLQKGQIMINGRNVETFGITELARIMGYVFQDHTAPFPIRH